MRIAVTKQHPILKQLAYAILSAGTTSDVWYEEERQEKQGKADSAPQPKPSH